MNLPPPLPENEKFKALFGWLNMLRAFVESLILRNSPGVIIKRTEAGTQIAIEQKSSDVEPIRSVFIYWLPGVELIKRVDGEADQTIIWDGLICVSNTSPPFNDFPPYILGDDLFNYYDLPETIDYYMVSLPPLLRARIGAATYSAQKFDASEFLYDDTFATVNGPFGEVFLDEDYQVVINQPYVSPQMLYIFKPHHDQFGQRARYYAIIQGQEVELNQGWVDLNVDARCLLPAGLVEGAMRVEVTLDDDGMVDPEGENIVEFPVIQTTNHP